MVEKAGEQNACNMSSRVEAEAYISGQGSISASITARARQHFLTALQVRINNISWAKLVQARVLDSVSPNYGQRYMKIGHLSKDAIPLSPDGLGKGFVVPGSKFVALP